MNLSEDAANKAAAPGLNIPTIANTTGLCQACASGLPLASAPVTATTSDKGFEKDGLHPGAGQSTKQPDRIAPQRKSLEDHEKELGNLLKPRRELSLRTKAKDATNGRGNGLSKSRSQRESTTGRRVTGELTSSSRVTPIKLYQSPLDDYAVTSKYELEERRRQAMAKSNSTRRQQQQQHQLPPPTRPGEADKSETSQAPLEMGVVSAHNDQKQPAKCDQPHRHSSSSDVCANDDISTLGAESVMSKGVTLKRIRERQGLCSECGNRTHTFVEDRTTGDMIKRPCSIDGLVHRGRCLKCHPLPPHMNQSSPAPPALAPIARVEPSPSESPTEAVNSTPSSAIPKAQARTEPMAPPASVGPTDKPKSILRRSSSYNSTSSLGSAKSDRSKKSVTISLQGDDSSIASEGENENDMNKLSFSTGNKSSNKSARSLVHGDDDSSDDDMPRFGRSKEYKERKAKRAARKEEKAAITRLLAIESCTAGGAGGDLIDIVATMRQHTTSEDVQLLGATKLYERSKSKSESKLIGRSGAIATILDSMKNHHKCVELHIISCKLTRNLARCADHNCKVLVKHGAFSLLCDSMERHQDEISIQSRGCAALASLADESAHTSTDEALFDKARVLACIVGAVSAFPEEEETLRAAYSALKRYGYKPMKVLAAWQDPSARRKLIASSA